MSTTAKLSIHRLGKTNLYLVYPADNPAPSESAVFYITAEKNRWQDKGWKGVPLESGWSEATKHLYGPEVRKWVDEMAHKFGHGAANRNESVGKVYEIVIGELNMPEPTLKNIWNIIAFLELRKHDAHQMPAGDQYGSTQQMVGNDQLIELLKNVHHAYVPDAPNKKKS